MSRNSQLKGFKHSMGAAVCSDLLRDVTVLVDVVQVEGPVEFFLDCAPQQNGEAHNKIL